VQCHGGAQFREEQRGEQCLQHEEELTRQQLQLHEALYEEALLEEVLPEEGEQIRCQWAWDVAQLRCGGSLLLLGHLGLHLAGQALEEEQHHAQVQGHAEEAHRVDG
jgi:hypothetical protein